MAYHVIAAYVCECDAVVCVLQVRAGASSQAGDTKQVEAALKAADQGLAAVEARRDALLATKSSLTDERNTGREQCAPTRTCGPP